MPKPPPENHTRPRLRVGLGTVVYGLLLALGASALTGSLIRQRFVTTERAEPDPKSPSHKAWCTGELVGLRVELEEAMLQELAVTHAKPDLTRAEQNRRKDWNARLAMVQARCRHSALAENSALGLVELSGQYVALVDNLHALRTGLAQAVDATLDHLKND